MTPILDRFSPGDTFIAIRLFLHALSDLVFAGVAGVVLLSFTAHPTLSGAETVGVALWMAMLCAFLYQARKRWFQFWRFYKMH